jgi:hypothetical protein
MFLFFHLGLIVAVGNDNSSLVDLDLQIIDNKSLPRQFPFNRMVCSVNIIELPLLILNE